MKKIYAFLILGLVVSLILSVGFFMQKESEKDKRVKTEQKLALFMNEKNKLTLQLNKTISEKDKEVSCLLAKLDKEVRMNAVLTANINRKYSRIGMAEAVTKPIELEKIVVSSLAEIEGKVLAVDNQNDLVVVNLGNRDGVKTGDRFSVYRGSEYIGNIELIKIQNQLSAASVSLDEKGIKVAVNDLIHR